MASDEGRSNSNVPIHSNQAEGTAVPWWLTTDNGDRDQKWKQVRSPGAFKRDLARACSEAQRTHPVSLLFIDFDNLKTLNTAVGEPKADQMLGAVISILSRCTAGKGGAYLFGHGDEYAAILPNSCLEEGVALAERLRSEVASIRLADLPQATVSIGVAQYPNDGIDGQNDLEEAANKAEKQAKESGKNRVCAWTAAGAKEEPSSIALVEFHPLVSMSGKVRPRTRVLGFRARLQCQPGGVVAACVTLELRDWTLPFFQAGEDDRPLNLDEEVMIGRDTVLCTSYEIDGGERMYFGWDIDVFKSTFHQFFIAVVPSVDSALPGYERDKNRRIVLNVSNAYPLVRWFNR